MMSYLKTKVKFQSVLEKHINIPFKLIYLVIVNLSFFEDSHINVLSDLHFRVYSVDD